MSKFIIAPKRFNDLLLNNMVTLEFKIVDTTGILNPRIIVREPMTPGIVARIRMTDLINPSSNFYLMKVRTEQDNGWENKRSANRHKHSVPKVFLALSDLTQKSLNERIDVKIDSNNEMSEFVGIFGSAPMLG